MSAAPSTLGRRDRKKEATRLAIEDAAWALFAERGYAATTVEDITERADIAPRTFFRYFPSKEAVLYGDPRPTLDAFRAALVSRPDGEDPYTAVRTAFGVVAAAVTQTRERCLLRHDILSEHGGRQMEDRFGALTVAREVLTETIAERLATSPDDSRPRLLAEILITVMNIAYARWIDQGATDDLNSIVGATFDTLAQLTNPGQTNDHLEVAKPSASGRRSTRDGPLPQGLPRRPSSGRRAAVRRDR
jgi:AcrR family transcriptional regulator